jgi:hypothetical protein
MTIKAQHKFLYCVRLGYVKISQQSVGIQKAAMRNSPSLILVAKSICRLETLRPATSKCKMSIVSDFATNIFFGASYMAQEHVARMTRA